ncbi:hypothetical protein HPB48_000089 [Haemaphysalis longicornis]|uniref:Uncharacterized protein n=1 Tax=Haemaphysalis longicornis TaxID=44386 RepID=A0A9J6FC97_HAELO|nr:hypothetical protein HPB48_000089 [Haemaphysalis longicornis]
MEEEGSSDAPPHPSSDLTESLAATGTAEVPEDSSDPKPPSGSDVTQGLGALIAVVQGSSEPPLYSACDGAERPGASRTEDVPEGSSEPPSCTTSSATESLDAAGIANVPESAPQWLLRIAGRVHKPGTTGYAHGDLDESDEVEEGIRIDDLDVSRLPWEVAKERLEQQHPPPQPSALEPVYQIIWQQVSHFTNVYVEREFLGGELVCVVCREAESTLLKIQEVVRKDPSMRAFVLGNNAFMGVLVKLCRLDSPVPPNMCGVLGPYIKRFVEKHGYWDGGSVSTPMKGHPNDKLWERFLDDAAMKIRRVTYSVRVLTSHSARKRRRFEPVAAPMAVHERCFYSSSNVSGCLDAQRLWIFYGAKARANGDGRLLAEVHRFLQEGPRENAPILGEIASLWTSEERLERVLVLEVAEEVALQPPAVSLAVLQEGKPAPSLGNTL